MGWFSIIWWWPWSWLRLMPIDSQWLLLIDYDDNHDWRFIDDNLSWLMIMIMDADLSWSIMTGHGWRLTDWLIDWLIDYRQDHDYNSQRVIWADRPLVINMLLISVGQHIVCICIYVYVCMHVFYTSLCMYMYPCIYIYIYDIFIFNILLISI